MLNLQYFLGANSPGGFYSLYHELLPTEQAKAIYILKGGAGCGKSSLMRRVARHAEAVGLDTVSILCSGDPDSLDALILPQRGIAIVDGTAPHIVEPHYPGVVESYVDLGSCYDRAGLAPLRQEIISSTDRYKGRYPRVYRCLEAAGQLRRDNRELMLTSTLTARMTKRAAGIIHREVKKMAPSPGAFPSVFCPLSPTGATSCCGTRYLPKPNGSMNSVTAMAAPMSCCLLSSPPSLLPGGTSPPARILWLRIA